MTSSRFVRRIPVPVERWWGDDGPTDGQETHGGVASGLDPTSAEIVAPTSEPDATHSQPATSSSERSDSSSEPESAERHSYNAIGLGSRFVRCVPAPPSPFQVDRPLLHPIPPGASPISPGRLDVFLARIDDRIEDILPLTAWQLPSWRPLEMTLDLTTLDRPGEWEGPEPLPGDLLWIWTWTDLPGDGMAVDRIFVQVERRQLDDAERQQARVALEALTTARRNEGATVREAETKNIRAVGPEVES